MVATAARRPAGPPARPARPRGWLARLAAWLLLATAAAGCSSLPAQVQRTPSRAWATPQETPLGQLAQARRVQAGAKAESGFFLLDSVDAAFGSRLALIEQARHTLDLQYYAIHADASTALLLERLRAAAQRGVRVRILLDDFNTVGDDAQVLRLAFVPGIEIRLFNPLPGSRGSLVGRVLGSLHDVDRLAKRMHNKLFLADSAWGIAGGRNLGDAYFGGDEASAFVDLDVLAAGAVVRQMAASFDRYWNDPLAWPVQSLLSRADLDDLARTEREPARDGTPPAPAAPPAPVASGLQAASAVLPQVSAAQVREAARPPLDLVRVPLVWAPATLLVDSPAKVGPGDDEAGAGDTTIDGLLQLMRGARQEVVIVSPYFVPGAQMLDVFRALRQRGVAVRVLTNSLASNDAPAAHAGYRRWRPALLDIGVELHEMRADPASAGLAGSARGGGSGVSLGSGVGGSKSGASKASLHSKAVVVDRRLAVIGSMNLDLRSQLKNSEVALVIRSGTLARQAVGIVEHSFARGSWRVQRAPGGGLHWVAPPGAGFADATREPEAPWKLRALVNLLAPFAPDEML